MQITGSVGILIEDIDGGIPRNTLFGLTWMHM